MVVSGIEELENRVWGLGIKKKRKSKAFKASKSSRTHYLTSSFPKKFGVMDQNLRACLIHAF